MKKGIIIFLIVLLIIVGVIMYYDNIDKNKDNINEVEQLSNTVENSINEVEENNVQEVEEEQGNDEAIELDNEESEEIKETVQKALSPRGFMGSSLKRVTLYSNGDVYIVNYDGSGYQKSNITSKELIAKGVSNIEYKGEEDDFEAIVIKGKDVKEINTNYTWIEFEK